MTAKPYPSYESWWYSDSARYEYLKSDLFWTLAILIIANSWWSAKQVDSFPNEDDNENDTAAVIKSSPATQPRRPGFWLKDRITSRLHQYLALLVCASAFPVQLLHGSWVLKSAWRISWGVFKRTYPGSLRPRLLGIALYSPVATFALLVWAAVVGAGVFIIATQILLWSKVWGMDPNAPPHLPSPKDVKRKIDGDGDWDDIKEDEQEGVKKD